MSLGAMVEAAVDRVSEVDANLLWGKTWLAIAILATGMDGIHLYIAACLCHSALSE